MLGFYNYTVIVTYLGLVSAIMGIFSAINGQPVVSIYCLILSGACDMFDGKIARTRERTTQEQKFGIQIDSLSDLVCFGVLPAVIAYTLNPSSKLWFIPVIYVLAALIRLAYFNVTEEERQKHTTEVRKYYEGLPVTSAAVIFPIVYCLKQFTQGYFHIIYNCFMIFVALLFLLRFKLKKPGMKGIMVFLAIGILELALVIFFAK